MSLACRVWDPSFVLSCCDAQSHSWWALQQKLARSLCYCVKHWYCSLAASKERFKVCCCYCRYVKFVTSTVGSIDALVPPTPKPHSLQKGTGWSRLRKQLSLAVTRPSLPSERLSKRQKDTLASDLVVRCYQVLGSVLKLHCATPASNNIEAARAAFAVLCA